MRPSKLIFSAVALAVIAIYGWRMQRDRAGGDAGSRTPASAAPHDFARTTTVPVASLLPSAPPSAEKAERVEPASLTEALRQALTAKTKRTRADFVQLRGLVQRAVRELEGEERGTALREVGAWAARENVPWGLELATGLEDFRERATLVGAMVDAALDLDPQAAAAWVAEVTDPALRDSAYQKVARRWAESDVPAAREWAAGLADTAARASASEGVAWTWAQRDSKAAYEWAAAIPEPAIRDQVFVKLAKLLAVQQPQEAVLWALQFPEGPAREQALHYAIFQWAAKDLTAAAEWSAKLTDKGVQSGSDVAIARSWSNQEAQGATVWAAEIADPAGRAVALATTLRKWAETNPVAAAAWLAQQGASPANEVLFRTVTSALATTHPTATGTWLNGIADPAWRAEGEQILAQRQQDARSKGAPPKS